jgi:thiosulfate dehydrogenase (quinone) large subunit
MNFEKTYGKTQLITLVVARVFIGWYFLYEGFVKLMNPKWTSADYLLDSQGFFSGIFYWMASDPAVLSVVDFLNIWGLIAIGAGLILGLFTQIATLSGIVLLSFYYLSHPAIIGVSYALPTEGNYLWVNKTLLEIALLCVLYVFPTGAIIGIDRILSAKRDNID